MSSTSFEEGNRSSKSITIDESPTSPSIIERFDVYFDKKRFIQSDGCGFKSSLESESRWSEPAESHGGMTFKERVVRMYADHCTKPKAGDTRPWKSTWIRLGPISGIIALLLAVAATAASLGILVGSDRTPVEAWPTPPSTYLAIFTILANMSTRYAAFQGAVLVWWRKALQGSTLGELHRNWRSGTSIRGAISSGRRMGLLGLACISATIVAFDGPLLQRASTVGQASYEHPVTLNVSMAPQLPTGYTGSWRAGKALDPVTIDFNRSVPAPIGRIPNNIWTWLEDSVFADVISLWQRDHVESYDGVVQGCPGTCQAKIVAPALAVTSCTTHTTPVNFALPAKTPIPDIAPPLAATAFLIGTNLVVEGDQEKLNLITGFAKSNDCNNGNLQYKSCTLESAIAEYDVLVSAGRMSLVSSASPRILSIAQNLPIPYAPATSDRHKSTLAGIATCANTAWDSSMWYLNISGTLNQWNQGSVSYLYFQVQTDSQSVCTNFTDPMDDYMASMNKLMVRFGAAAAQGLSRPNLTSLDPDFDVNSTVKGIAEGSQPVFRTNYYFFVGAIVLEALCICLVAPTYWGWWKIGRRVSFSPLEIAKAFEAPLLESINSTSSAGDVAQSGHDREVRYGMVPVNSSGAHWKLAFALPSVVRKPEQDISFEM